MTPDERAAVWRLVAEVKAALDEELRPHGYNIGFNAGTAAGQTVMHVHLHVIPRFEGDMDWRDEIAAGERGRFEARLIEVRRHPITSFHPKSWRFEGPALTSYDNPASWFGPNFLFLER